MAQPDIAEYITLQLRPRKPYPRNQTEMNQPSDSSPNPPLKQTEENQAVKPHVHHAPHLYHTLKHAALDQRHHSEDQGEKQTNDM